MELLIIMEGREHREALSGGRLAKRLERAAAKRRQDLRPAGALRRAAVPATANRLFPAELPASAQRRPRRTGARGGGQAALEHPATRPRRRRPSGRGGCAPARRRHRQACLGAVENGEWRKCLRCECRRLGFCRLCEWAPSDFRTGKVRQTVSSTFVRIFQRSPRTRRLTVRQAVS